jgi:hypothetical protein
VGKNRFRVCSVSNETVSQLILNDGFEKQVAIFTYVEHARKMVTRWLNIHNTHENHFCTPHAFQEFFPCHLFLCPLHHFAKKQSLLKSLPPSPSFRPLLPGGHKEMSSILADQ